MDNQEPGGMHEHNIPGSEGPGGAMPEAGPGAPAPQPGQYPGGYQQPPGQPYQPPQGQPYQPPQGGYPPPPPGGYQQPQGGYPPPPGGYQQPGGQYAPPPGYAPPPPSQGQRKGFNWLACCGISCGALLLIGVLSWVIMMKSCGGLIGPVIQMGMVASEVEKTDESTITSGAQAVSSEELSGDPASYKGDWIAVEGVLGNQSDPMAQQMSSQSGQKGTGYFMEPNIIIMDMSNAPPVGDEADTVKAYGKAVNFDLKEMLKSFGEDAVKEIENDPEMHGQTNFVMVFAKKVDLVAAGEPEPEPADSAAGAEAGDAAAGGAEGSESGADDASANDGGSEGSETNNAGASTEKEGW